MNVVIMCSRGYGNSFSAINTKSELIALGLIAAGVDVHIIDSVKGIRAINCCQEKISQAGVSYAAFPEGRGKRLLSNIKEYKSLLLKYKKSADINHIIIGMDYMPIFISLSKIAHNLGYSTSTLFHEWHISMPSKRLSKTIHKYWQDYCFGKYMDAIFPISHFLQAKAEHFDKPMMLLPVLGNFDKQYPTLPKPQFTYCADAGYLMRNKIVLDAFEILYQSCANVRLNLVLFGLSQDIVSVKSYLLSLTSRNNVSILFQISNSELQQLYFSSLGLLIPLDPNSLQDKARFSQKIAEYLTSTRPIITSNVGEVPFYFENRINAMVVDYSASAYAHAMKSLVDDNNLADRIGQKGYELGRKNFNYLAYGNKLKTFIASLPCCRLG